MNTLDNRVQAFIAVVLTASLICYIFVFHTLPPELATPWGLVIGYYFGSRGGNGTGALTAAVHSAIKAANGQETTP